MGQRRARRLQRARRLHVGTAVVVAGALLAGAITFIATTVIGDDAAAGTETAAPARAPRPERNEQVQRLVVARAHTAIKTTITKFPPPPVNPFPPAPAGSGEGRRVVYCNSCQRVWLIEESGWVFASYTVSGRRNYPSTGTYEVIRRVHPGWSKTLRLPYFVGFTYGSTTDVGFHGIPIEPDGDPIQGDDELGQYRSHGCVRQSQGSARLMWDWATMGTKVVVVA